MSSGRVEPVVFLRWQLIYLSCTRTIRTYKTVLPLVLYSDVCVCMRVLSAP